VEPAVILFELADRAPNVASADSLFQGIGHVPTAMPQRRWAALAPLRDLGCVDVREPHHRGADLERVAVDYPGGPGQRLGLSSDGAMVSRTRAARYAHEHPAIAPPPPWLVHSGSGPSGISITI
jgi:hypothetical protein